MVECTKSIHPLMAQWVAIQHQLLVAFDVEPNALRMMNPNRFANILQKACEEENYQEYLKDLS